MGTSPICVVVYICFAVVLLHPYGGATMDPDKYFIQLTLIEYCWQYFTSDLVETFFKQLNLMKYSFLQFLGFSEARFITFFCFCIFAV